MEAIRQANEAAEMPEVLVLIRGGGSADDLAAFSDERVVRAVVASRVPTLVAIGHEIDVSLAELAADMRASTPSNAAELLFPDKKEELRHIRALRTQLDEGLRSFVSSRREGLRLARNDLDRLLMDNLDRTKRQLSNTHQLLQAYDPSRPLNKDTRWCVKPV